MTTGVPDLIVGSYDPGGLQAYRDDLLELYAEVYAERLDDPFFSLPRYWERLAAYGARDGFTVVTGRLENELIGYALGYTLPAGSRWWQGLRQEVDPDLLEENGRRTFALTEIMVGTAWRRRGYARVLHDALLTDRREQRATLLVLPDNVPAKAAYLAWGWYKLGELQPFDDAPVYDAMMLELKGR
jgi:ribosomal protein S18 acetylase RimI-like enzyme